MCEHCAGDAPCTLASCAGSGTGCACTRAGPPRCPACGHECLPWYFGLGLVDGPPLINDFLGGAGSENPGFQGYPATRASLLAAAKAFYTDIEDEGVRGAEDLAWLERELPDRPYRDVGDVLTALGGTVRGPSLEGATWMARSPLGAIPIGAHLIVPPAEMALLVGRRGTSQDVFPPGDHLLTRASAPRAAEQSREPAPGSDRAVLESTPVFYSTREQAGRLTVAARTRAGSRYVVNATVRYALRDPARFTATIGRNLSPSAPSSTVLGVAVSGPLTAMVGQQEDAALAADPKAVESTIRAALEAAGFEVRSVALGPSGSPLNAAMGGTPSDALARLPPEQRAMVQARMEEAMRRRAAAGAASRSASPPPAGGAPAPGGPGSGPSECPACGAANPPRVKFCGSCGRPIPQRRACPSCGAEAGPTVKFCGSCGARVP